MAKKQMRIRYCENHEQFGEGYILETTTDKKSYQLANFFQLKDGDWLHWSAMRKLAEYQANGWEIRFEA